MAIRSCRRFLPPLGSFRTAGFSVTAGSQPHRPASFRSRSRLRLTQDWRFFPFLAQGPGVSNHGCAYGPLARRGLSSASESSRKGSCRGEPSSRPVQLGPSAHSRNRASGPHPRRKLMRLSYCGRRRWFRAQRRCEQDILINPITPEADGNRVPCNKWRVLHTTRRSD
jgi:hypothetical protein